MRRFQTKSLKFFFPRKGRIKPGIDSRF
jgi:hypothetical protein